MSNRNRLVLNHLEDISWHVLEEYSQIIKEMIKGQAGVYALYRKGKLYYVGLASNLMTRLKTHLRDRHHGEWDRFSVYFTLRDDHIKELESLILRIVNPIGNKTTGKFVNSLNLKSELNNRIIGYDADRRAKLLGGSVAKRRRRTKTRKGRGSSSLAGIFERRIKLIANYKGKEYIASLRQDGTIGYKKRVFKSPTSAAKAIIGRMRNGWTFWKYKNEKGDWVPIKELRR